jgi:hypothetical protein
MPTFKGFTVHVTNDQGERLEEYNILCHGSRTRTKHSTCTCYIESKAGQAFRIAIDPFGIVSKGYSPPPSTIPGHDHYDGLAVSAEGQPREPIPTPSGTEEGQVPETFDEGPDAIHYLATLYMDGRPKPDNSVIIYTDSAHPYYEKITVMRRHWDWDPVDEQLKDCTWAFKDVGIEHIMAQLTVDTDEGDVDDDIAEILQKLVLDDENSEEMSKIGCIEVTLEQVRVHKEAEYTPHLLVEGDAVPKKTEVTNGISHIVERRREKLSNVNVSSVHYSSIEEGAPPYAKFTFFYRKANVLAKLRETELELRPSPPPQAKGKRKATVFEELAVSANVTSDRKNIRMRPTRKRRPLLDSWTPTDGDGRAADVPLPEGS